jgi:fimbrial isopeptide formation D2 family protein/uncharacterized repeat protein (TIGR01451 family)
MTRPEQHRTDQRTGTRGRRLSRRLRALAQLLVGALVAGLAVVASLVPATPALATSNPTGSVTVGGNTFYAYVAAGESLDVAFAKRYVAGFGTSAVKFRVTDPSGAVRMDCEISAAAVTGTSCSTAGMTGPTGVWIIEEVPLTSLSSVYLKPASNSRFSFDIDVRDASSAMIAGRVWTDTYMAYDASGASNYDLGLWVVTQFGAVYTLGLGGFTGGGWNIQADAFGIVDGTTCTPLYHSTAMTTNVASYNDADASCGDKYWLFFEAPATDLPKTALSARGELWVKPDVSAPTINSLAFAQTSPGSLAGTFSYELANFTGTYTLQIDTDGDGSYDGPRDRTIALGGSGPQSYAWDGLDGLGDPVDPYAVAVHAQVLIDKTDEFHIVLADVEGITRGLTLTQLQGNAPGNTTLYWDDTRLPTSGKTSTTTPVDGTNGVDSASGAHAWAASGSNQWGNQSAIDNWTYSPVNVRSAITLAQGRLELSKTSTPDAETRVGDTVNYVVTATNTGSAAYTEADPAVVLDDLSGVLDDGTYNADATATQAGTVSFASPLLSWTGALGIGESVQLSYTVTLNSGGDGNVRNVAWAPTDPGSPTTPACNLPTGGSTDPSTGEPCAVTQVELPRLAITKTADRTDLPAVGESVAYTVTVTNVGPGDYTAGRPASFVDDLSDVLDDATFDGPATATTGTASFADPTLSWTGVLASGQTATIEYTVTYTGGGDRSLVNVACVPTSETAAGANSCARVTVPGARLTQWKSVTSSGSPAVAGSVLTYTLHFGNDGSAAATVDAIDDLKHVLDDADLTADPAASAGLTVARNGEALSITGAVGPGQVATVTYEVTIKPDGERGDDIAANFLMANDPGNPPVTPTTPTCAPLDVDEPSCTSTPIAAVAYEKTVSASADPIATGSVLTYTITIRSTGAATAPVSRDDVLADVIDDATLTSAPQSDTGSVTVGAVANGRFHIGGELAGGSTATVGYQVTVNDAADRGNDSADNFLVAAGEAPPSECAAGATDCTVTPLPAIAVTKTADPESGTAVAAGEDVTYTLTFTNRGQATGAADYTDDLSGVLDDADLGGGPTTSAAGLTAALQKQSIRVTGTVAAQETITVRYTVTVKADAGSGDGTLRNVVVLTGREPVCVSGSQQCTEHPIIRAGGVLASTGGTTQPWLLGLLLLLPAGGALLVAARLRRHRVKTRDAQRG